MVAKALLFLSSYAPLFAIFAIRFDDLNLRIACAVLVAAGIGSLAVVLRVQRRLAAAPHQIEEVRAAGGEAAAYLAAYILPFVTVSDPRVQDVLGYLVFLGVAAMVHMQTAMVQVNPLLFVLGFKVTEVRNSDGKRFILIAQESPLAGDTIRAVIWDDNVYVRTRDRA